MPIDVVLKAGNACSDWEFVIDGQDMTDALPLTEVVVVIKPHRWPEIHLTAIVENLDLLLEISEQFPITVNPNRGAQMSDHGFRWALYNLAFCVFGKTRFWNKLGQAIWR